MSVSFEIKYKIDNEKLDAVIRKVGNQRAAMQLAAETTATEIRKNMLNKGVYDTGALYKSIEVEVSDNGFVVHDGPARDGNLYGVYNEFGTWKMAARPFFIPALEKIGYFYAASMRKHMR